MPPTRHIGASPHVTLMPMPYGGVASLLLVDQQRVVGVQRLWVGGRMVRRYHPREGNHCCYYGVNAAAYQRRNQTHPIDDRLGYDQPRVVHVDVRGLDQITTCLQQHGKQQLDLA